MDNQMFDKYVADPFERCELHINPTMYERLKERFSDTAQRVQISDRQSGLSYFPAQTPLAMAYIPFQQWEEPYTDERALSSGTAFSSLDKPFSAYGGDCCD